MQTEKSLATQQEHFINQIIPAKSINLKFNTMIYKLTFTDDRIDWCTAKDQLHLLKSYDAEFDLDLQEIESVEEISEDEAKKIMLTNSDYNEDDPDDRTEIPLFDLVVGDDFSIIGSNEWE